LQKSIPSICIVGIGNPLRTEYCIGVYTIDLINIKQLPGVHTIATQQLDSAMIEELSGFNEIVFVDAAVNTSTIKFEQITDDSTTPQDLSHHITAVLFTKIAQQLYSSSTQFYICTIPADHLDIGKKLSKKSTSTASKAVTLLTAWITKKYELM